MTTYTFLCLNAVLATTPASGKNLGCFSTQLARAALLYCKITMIPRLLRPRFGQSVFRRYKGDLETLKSQLSENDSISSTKTTGVIDHQNLDHVLLFFSRVYPRWVARLLSKKVFGILNWFQGALDDEKWEQRVRSFVSSLKYPLPPDVKIDEFVPMKRDGGAFVNFKVPPNSTPKDVVSLIQNNVHENLSSFRKSSYWRTQVFPVKGTPWIEDLNRFPSSRLKVIFGGQALTDEELYVMFRRYGHIEDIIPSSSTVPYATVVFQSTEACICAKNCITGFTLNLGKTTLHLQYIPAKRVNYITDFINNHQRIALPIIFAILATITVLVFEPIRQHFIETKIKRKYTWDSHKNHWLVKLFYIPYRTLVDWINNSRHFIDDSIVSITGESRRPTVADIPIGDMESDLFWAERSEKAEQLKMWIFENANTFIIVKGPKGSGKREFVTSHALHTDEKFSRKLLEIDCDPLIKSRADNIFLKRTAGQLGYFPIFTWTNSISQFVDLGLQGLTGQKSGLSESKETQFKNMLLLTASAIRRVALSDFESYKVEYNKQLKQKIQLQGEDPEVRLQDIKEDDYLQLHPEEKPVIIVHNFLRKTESQNDFIYKLLAEWGAQLILSNTAHVIFVTSDLGSVSHLNTALPNQVFKTVSLADATMQSAQQYVLRQLQNITSEKPLSEYLAPIGGRMLDLQAFVRRVRSGESMDHALEEMVTQAAEQITTFFLNATTPSLGGNEATWSSTQIWALMKLLADKDSINFDELSKSPLFADDKESVSTLSVLEKNDLVSLHSDKGILVSVAAGRPLYRAAIKNLVDDPKVYKLYETRFVKNLIQIENDKIAKLEDEINKIAHLRDSKYVKERLEYIFEKINGSTDLVRGYEGKIKELASLGQDAKKGIFGF